MHLRHSKQPQQMFTSLNFGTKLKTHFKSHTFNVSGSMNARKVSHYTKWTLKLTSPVSNTCASDMATTLIETHRRILAKMFNICSNLVWVTISEINWLRIALSLRRFVFAGMDANCRESITKWQLLPLDDIQHNLKQFPVIMYLCTNTRAHILIGVANMSFSTETLLLA